MIKFTQNLVVLLASLTAIAASAQNPSAVTKPPSTAPVHVIVKVSADGKSVQTASVNEAPVREELESLQWEKVSPHRVITKKVGYSQNPEPGVFFMRNTSDFVVPTVSFKRVQWGYWNRANFGYFNYYGYSGFHHFYPPYSYNYAWNNWAYQPTFFYNQNYYYYQPYGNPYVFNNCWYYNYTLPVWF